jgi:uncharacterized membrane protein
VKPPRLHSIDAARGAAMLLVFYAHFSEIYLGISGRDALMMIDVRISQIAPPTFMLISGMMLGYLHFVKDDFRRIKLKYVDKGLFLVTVGRLIIYLAHVPLYGGFIRTLRVGFITDTYGFCMLLAPFLVERLRAWARIAMAVLLFIACWVLFFEWSPSGWAMIFLKETFIGKSGQFEWKIYLDNFSYVPWFCLYLTGTVLGEALGSHAVSRNGNMKRFVLKCATALLLLAFAVAAAYRSLKAFGLMDATAYARHYQLAGRYQKYPPSIVYIAFHSAIGLLLLYALMRMEERQNSSVVVNRLAVLGRTSLFVFILQYWVFKTFFNWARLDYTSFWPLYFLAGASLVYVIASFWDRHNLNRFLTMPASIRVGT